MEIFCPVDSTGNFTEDAAASYAGMHVREANPLQSSRY